MEFDVHAEMSRGRRAEVLSSWYLRFNGFLPLPGFILHDGGAEKQLGQQLTDADIIGARLPHTCELIETAQGGPIKVRWDEEEGLGQQDGLSDFVIVEVSSGPCKSNWLREDNSVNEQYLRYCLRRLGQWNEDDVGKVASLLSASPKKSVTYPDDAPLSRVKLISMGLCRSDLPTQQISFDSMLRYMQDRLFGCYDPYGSPEKVILSDHKQWHPLVSQVYWRLRGRKFPLMTPEQLVAWLFPTPTTEPLY